jgi:hypothetical protein
VLRCNNAGYDGGRESFCGGMKEANLMGRFNELERGRKDGS